MSEITRYQLPRSPILLSEYQGMPLSFVKENQDQILSTNIISTLQIPVTPDEVQNILVSIQAAFGCSTSGLAEVLRVDKAMIFSWLRGESEPDGKHSYRIRLVEELANVWKKLCCLPAKKVLRFPFENGVTLWNELCAENLDYHKILNVMDSAAQLLNEKEVPKYKNKKTPQNAKPSSVYEMLTHNAYLLEEDE
ncbi:MAG: hypothetical protein LBP59_03635 [Planctomycetaceae bacterium]|jgi:DNA-binding transcriptional regulator YiaG|nr:hypothetical protein [Planctomycetaceae bacterium]